jgi:hypothetical protein
MKSKYITVLFLIVLALTSCSIPKATELPAPIEPSGDSTAIVQISPTEKSTPISSSIDAAKCTEFSQKELAGNGYLIAMNLSPSVGEMSTDKIIDMKTLDSENFVTKNDFDVSPTGKALAYIDIQNNAWVLIVADEEKTIEIPMQGRVTYIKWVNDQTIAIKEDYEPETYTLFLNPFSGDWKRIETNFPDMYANAGGLINPWRGNIPAFDPTLTYAAYPSYVSDPGFAGINLTRIEDGAVVGRFEMFPYIYPPVWSPLGESLIVPSSIGEKRELIRVFVDHRTVALTNFSVNYPNFALYSYRWSPDGRRIAFWFVEDYRLDNKAKSLAIIDLDSNNVTITCIRSENNILDFNDNPVWSPDSNQLVVQIQSNSGPSSSLALVDFRQTSYELIVTDTYLSPVGWITFKPKLP